MEHRWGPLTPEAFISSRLQGVSAGIFLLQGVSPVGELFEGEELWLRALAVTAVLRGTQPPQSFVNSWIIPQQPLAAGISTELHPSSYPSVGNETVIYPMIRRTLMITERCSQPSTPLMVELPVSCI